MTDPLTYYASAAPMTDPGPYTALLDELPSDIGELCKIVQGVTVHIYWTERYGVKLPDERKDEVQLRTLSARLARTLEFDSQPLIDTRPPEKRLVGNCRDFTLLLVSILRHQGVPARARCGFGAYFFPNHFEDHWVAEYWNADQKRWTLVDAQLDTLQSEVLHLSFDSLDVPRNQFIVGGRAWQMCRREGADPDQFGIFNMHGLGFIRGNFIRDVAALNKVELLPWDCWGLIEKPELDEPDDLAFLDHLADLTAGDVPNITDVQNIYQSDSRLHMDGTVTSYTATGPHTISIPL